MEPCLSVIMPVFEEERTLPQILARVLARPEVLEVVAVDDGSRDRSWEILADAARREPRLKPLHLAVNRGKGAAVRAALAVVSGRYAIVQDADLELSPDDYPALLEPLVQDRADAVLGSRRFVAPPGFDLFLAGNRGLTAASNFLFHARLSDVLCGFKLLPTPLWRQLGFLSDGFGIDAEVTARLLRLRVRIAEVQVGYVTRSRKDGKKIRWRDGLLILRTLARVRLRSEAQLFKQANPTSPGGDAFWARP